MFHLLTFTPKPRRLWKLAVKSSKTIQIPFLWLKSTTYTFFPQQTSSSYMIYILYWSRLWFLLKCLSVSHKHISIKSCFEAYTFQKIQWRHWKQLWPLCFSAGWLHLLEGAVHLYWPVIRLMVSTLRSETGKLIVDLYEQKPRSKCEGNILTWDNSINQKWKDSFISTTVGFLAALCRNNYDVFCTSSQYITICVRFTKGDESKRKECAKRQLQSRWAGRLNLTEMMQLYERRQEIYVP